MFDYSQRPSTPDWDKNYSKIFTNGIMDVGKPLSYCHYEGSKYICACKGNICKKDVKR